MQSSPKKKGTPAGHFFASQRGQSLIARATKSLCWEEEILNIFPTPGILFSHLDPQMRHTTNSIGMFEIFLYNISVPEALCVSTDSTNGYKWAIKWSTSALGTQAFELAILSKASLANHLCQPKCMATSGKIPDTFCGATMEGEGF